LFGVYSGEVRITTGGKVVVAMDGIGNEYINHAIDELAGFLGIKENIPPEAILEPFRNGKTKECVEKIADYLGLPIKVNLSISDRFESRQLATTNHAGQGVEGINAQVAIPNYLPSYGSSAFNGLPIHVKVSGNCSRFPETFVSIIAHELSHIILHSLLHAEKNNEFYTDLTAMILGFSKVIRLGRKVVVTRQNYPLIETTTTRFGYLSDEMFEFAFQRIQQILRVNIKADSDLRKKIRKKLNICRKQVAFYNRDLLRFRNFVEFLDKDLSRGIRQEDANKIVEFHQTGYFDYFVAVIKNSEQKLKAITGSATGLLKDTKHYNLRRLDSLRVLIDRLDELVLEQQQALDLLRNNIKTVAKYIGLFNKFKINRLVRSL